MSGSERDSTVTDDTHRLYRHARVLFDTDERGRITRLNEPHPEADAPRVFLARGRAATLILFRVDVSDEIGARLAALAGRLGCWDGQPTASRALDPLRKAVRAWIGEVEESHGPAFRFPEAISATQAAGAVLIDEANANLLDANFPYTRSVLEWRSPVAGMVRDGAVVSACYSARRRPEACEAGVDTVEPHRGNGLAAAVVSAWGAAVRAAGMAPLYSTTWDNSASLRVAVKLALDSYADTVSFG